MKKEGEETEDREAIIERKVKIEVASLVNEVIKFLKSVLFCFTVHSNIAAGESVQY